MYHQFDNSKKNFHYNAYVYGDDVSYNSHFHDSYELIYVIEGALDVAINGSSMELCEHEILLLSPNAVHSFVIKESSKVWVGVFSSDHIEAFFKKYRSVQFGKFSCGEETEQILRNRLFLQEKPDRYSRIAYLYLVCAACEGSAEYLNTHNEQKFMHAVISYISKNLENEISLNGLAEELGYEYHYLSGLFNQCFSVNFKRFLNLYKVERACALLVEDDCNIMSVYKQCGFESMRNFNRVFKEITGYTPSEYKKNF
jgi:AraC-like DNA-binding protein